MTFAAGHRFARMVWHLRADKKWRAWFGAVNSWVWLYPTDSGSKQTAWRCQIGLVWALGRTPLEAANRAIRRARCNENHRLV